MKGDPCKYCGKTVDRHGGMVCARCKDTRSYEANRESILEQQKKYFEANKPALLARAKAYREASLNGMKRAELLALQSEQAKEWQEEIASELADPSDKKDAAE